MSLRPDSGLGKGFEWPQPLTHPVSTMHECTQCGAEVTERYWRVFSVEGDLHGCLHCESKTGQHLPSSPDARSASASG